MEITQETVKRLFTYEPDTGYLVWKYNPQKPKGWNTQWAGRRAGSYRGDKPSQVGIDGTLYFAHKLVWLYLFGEWCDYIEHRNGDNYDNREHNLRESTHSQNHGNRNNPYRGVTIHGQRFRARIGVGNKRIHLGYFYSEQDAYDAYNEASKKYFGEFSSLNR